MSPDDNQNSRSVANAELTYLVAEFETAWRHLGGLENKRLAAFLGYGLMSCLLLVAFAGNAAVGDWPIRAVIAGWLFLLSVALRYIALSERLATERYRNKINLLRRTLLDLAASARLEAMQLEGNDWALQVKPSPTKALRATDLMTRSRWTTALFMKLTYDAGAMLGIVLLVVSLIG